MTRRTIAPAHAGHALLLLLAVLIYAAPGQAGDVGRRLYREGLLPDGNPVQAVLGGSVPLRGKQAACVNCHRRSGFGKGEGQVYVPPITGPALFNESAPERAEFLREFFQEIRPESVRARLRYPNLRPAYTAATLATAIRDGRDPTGRVLNPVMPHYRLDAQALAALTAYLKRLSRHPDPGVDSKTIHFATIVDEAMDPERSAAMLAVITAYVRRKNLDTGRELDRPKHSPHYKDVLRRTLRQWQVHVWTLKGATETWQTQLEAAYARQPVFAILGGISAQAWRAVHEFCETIMLPCLFPQTELPVTAAEGAYTLYLSRGLPGEAEALARYLSGRLLRQAKTRIVQLYRNTPLEQRPAAAFRAAARRFPHLVVEDHMVTDASGLDQPFWRSVLGTGDRPVLVSWLDQPDHGDLAAVFEAAGRPEIYMSHSRTAAALSALSPPIRAALRLTYPFALPGDRAPRQYRARAWLRSRGIRRVHEDIQLNTWATMAIADDALSHLLEHFNRDYFIEIIEHRIENEFNPGLVPRFSLGPGQRFASKGAYIVRLSGSRGKPARLEAVSSWLISE